MLGWQVSWSRHFRKQVGSRQTFLTRRTSRFLEKPKNNLARTIIVQPPLAGCGKTMLMKDTDQLEIGLSTPPCRRSRATRQVRAARAQWWFQRMHRVVEAAMEWQPAAAAPTSVVQPPLPLLSEQKAA
jgi:hypothetical protein